VDILGFIGGRVDETYFCFDSDEPAKNIELIISVIVVQQIFRLSDQLVPIIIGVKV